MKNLFTRLIPTALLLVLLTGLSSPAAAQSLYSDIQGHWAETTLIRAADDALIEPTGTLLTPDAPITGGEAITILCKVLSAEKLADISEVTDISTSDSIYTAAAKAVALGLISPIDNRLDLNEPMKRSRVFVLLAEAFQLTHAAENTSVLSEFIDGNNLTGKARTATSALISSGYITGYSGLLHISDNMTRAEFLTVLYKIAPNYLNSGTITGSVSGATLISGHPLIYSAEFSDAVYFDCSTSEIRLHSVTAPSVIVRSDRLGSLNLSASIIDRFVIATGDGDLSFTPDQSNTIDTVVVGAGSGIITLSGNLSNVEITGNDRTVALSSPVESLHVYGSNNTITIDAGVTLDSIKIDGTNNTVTVNGAANDCAIFGSITTLNGSGTIQNVLNNSPDSRITVDAIYVVTNKNYGLNGVNLTLTAPDTLPAYLSLEASVAINAPDGSQNCRGAWYLDDVYISDAEITLGSPSTVALNRIIRRREEPPKTSKLTFLLSYTSSDGYYQELQVDHTIILENATKFDRSEVLSLVTTGYKGDYTLKWAQSNDFNSGLKEAWINFKGYTSQTQYLVWVSIAHQRVNVFTGSSGSWTLERTYIVGTGATGKDTPVGVFKVIGRNAKGWTSKTYTVKPVINFINSAYGFHSRLYYPGTTKISDAQIGFPVSHGCVRMYDDDVAWIYDNIPTGTAVIVF